MLEATTQTFEELVLKSEKPVLVDFTAPWCVYCRRITPALEQIASEQDAFSVIKVDIDQSPELATQYAVETIPSLLYFRQGKAGETLIAPNSKASILDWIAQQGESEHE